MNDEEHHRDPYPHYKELRERCPVAHSDVYGGYWIVSSHADISAVLSDAETFSSKRVMVHDSNSAMLSSGMTGPDGLDLGKPLSLTTMDPPAHTTFRRLILPLFSPKMVQSWEPGIRTVTQDLLQAVKVRGSCEFTAEVAEELGILVFLDILGVPEEDHRLLKEVHEKLRLLPSGALSRDEAQEYQMRELACYAELLEKDLGAPPTDTVISYLNNAEVDGQALTLQQKMRLCQQFSRAGLHTTASTLSNIMVYLATHPSDRDRLAADPALIPAGVEEFLRFESISAPARLVTRDVKLGDEVIHAGEMVLAPLGSAGRDEKVFVSPEEVRFDRTGVNHLAFGVGRHHCIGKHLARAQLRIALEEIHRIIPGYRILEDRPLVRHTGTIRTTSQLWLAV